MGRTHLFGSVIGATAFLLVVYIHVNNRLRVDELEMPLPLNDDSVQQTLSEYPTDYGYYSADPNTRAYKEIARALEAGSNSSVGSVAVIPGVAKPETAGPIKRVSIFDQWSDPGGDRGIVENPSTQRFNATSQKQICDSACSRPGWNPEEQVRKKCFDLCQSLYDATKEEAVVPQPTHHGWWLRKIGSGSDSRFVRYRSNGVSSAPPVQQAPVQKKSLTTKLLQVSAFPHQKAVEDLNSFFDSLPTKGCHSADCNGPVKKAVHIEKKQPHVAYTTTQVRKYERNVLGYHRRQEQVMEREELSHIGSESDKIVTSTMRGYEKLQHDEEQLHASGDHPHSSAKAAASVARPIHSHEYTRASSRPGFAGYYDNVFATSASSPARRSSPHPAVVANVIGALRNNMGKVARRLEFLKARRAELLADRAARSQHSHQRMSASTQPAVHKASPPRPPAVAIPHKTAVPPKAVQAVARNSADKSKADDLERMREATMARTEALLTALQSDEDRAAASAKKSKLAGPARAELSALELRRAADLAQLRDILHPSPAK